MSCNGCPGVPPVEGWRLIPEIAMSMDPLVTTPPPPAPPQPDRAPPAPSGVPTWIWIVLALMTIALLSERKS
jgi:hypothetical protein